MAGDMTEKNHTQKRKGKFLFVCGIVIIIALVAIIVILLFKGGEADETKRNVVVNKENAEQVAGEMIKQEYIAPGYYSASMTTTWHFETGDGVSKDAYVENLPENTNDVYFDLFLAGQEEEPIYQSPVIPRGSELNEITLDKPLEAGSHDCVLIYHLVDEEQKTISTLRVAVVILVEK